MIRLNDGLNEVIVTLTERSTLSTPIYLFVFTNQITNNQVSFIAQDTSGYSNRFNRFLVLVNDGLNPLVGEIELSDFGYYGYEIWEQESESNLDPLNATNKLESGLMKYEYASQSDSFYTAQNRQNKTYKG